MILLPFNRLLCCAIVVVVIKLTLSIFFVSHLGLHMHGVLISTRLIAVVSVIFCSCTIASNLLPHTILVSTYYIMFWPLFNVNPRTFKLLAYNLLFHYILNRNQITFRKIYPPFSGNLMEKIMSQNTYKKKCVHQQNRELPHFHHYPCTDRNSCSFWHACIKDIIKEAAEVK